MKKIEAVVDLIKADEIKQAVERENIQRITVFEVKGAARAQGKPKEYRGIQYIEEAPEIKVEVIVDDDEADHVADAILTALRTGNLSDAEVAILPIEKLTRVRIAQRDSSRSNWRDDKSPTYLIKDKIRLRSRLKTFREKFFRVAAYAAFYNR